MRTTRSFRFVLTLGGFLTFALSAAAAHADSAMVYENEYVVTRDNPRARSANTAPEVEVLHFSGNGASSTRAAHQRRQIRRDSASNRCAEIKAADSSIKTCDPNHIIKMSATPNDPRFANLWGLRNTTGGPDIGATTAWNVTTGVRSRGIVAVLDTGVDYNHQDLAANMWRNPNEVQNGLDDDQNGYVDDIFGINAITGSGNPMDDNEHGTHCSGTIAGAGNNGIGVAGVNWQAQIIGVKFLDAQGSGDLASEVRGLNYIGDLKQFKGVDIVAVNASYGSSSSSQAEFNAIARLRNLGILFMAAAGNESSNNDSSPSFPANFNLDNIISVAAIQIGGNLASFSNYGVNKVHIAAPGEDIVSTVPGNGYASFSGTSMATPHVVGAAALLKSAHPEFTAAQIRSAILTYGTPYPTLTGLVQTGKILNVAAMLGASPAPAPAPEPAHAPAPTPAPQPEPEPQPQPAPGDVELFDIAVGGDVAASQKVMSNKGTVYVAMAQNSASSPQEEVAYLMAAINGVACPQVASADVASGDYVLVSGQFKNLPRSSYVTFFVLNGEGQLTDHDTVLVLDRKNRGKLNYGKACNALFQSLRYAY